MTTIILFLISFLTDATSANNPDANESICKTRIVSSSAENDFGFVKAIGMLSKLNLA